MSVTIYHNPRCSKSREALALLHEHGHAPEVVEYLDSPLDRAGLERVLGLLSTPADDLLRKEGAALRGQNADRILDAIVADPALMERPIIVVDDARAVIARPPERLLDIL